MSALSEAMARAKAKATAFAAPKFCAEKKGDAGEIYVYDDIGQGEFGEGVTPKGVAEALATLKGVKTLHVYINSPGGSVFDGVAIYNQIRRFDAKKIVHVDGIAASSASMIAMAGDEIRMAHNAQIMIHDAWSYVAGNAEDMRAAAELLERITTDSVLASYSRTKQTAEQLRAWMRAETWMNATEAKERGFADAVDGPSGLRNGGEQARVSPLVHMMRMTEEQLAGAKRDRRLADMKREMALHRMRAV